MLHYSFIVLSESVGLLFAEIGRYCMVLFAGIAAEALVYGEAEGGENDENLFRSICVLLDPPLSVAQVVVLSSYFLL